MHKASVLCMAVVLLVIPAIPRAECPPHYIFTGEAAYDDFGGSVSGAGDVNNDGYDDLIVGAHRTDAGGVHVGQAYVYSGLDGSLLHSFICGADSDFFASSVSGAGDVNNDGYADLIVGAGYNDAGGAPAGQAYVYSGPTGLLLYTFTGEADYDLFGRSVSGAGDVNNDGYADLIVGAPSNDAGGTMAGRVYVYSGRNGSVLHTFTGEAAGDYFGHSVSSAGDVDGDSYDDLIAGAHGNDAGGHSAGRAYVYSGLNGSLLYTVTAEGPYDYFGWSVSGAGDVNKDGYADVIVGADQNEAGGYASGRAYVYSGLIGSLLYTFTGQAAFHQLGKSVSGAGDVNSDGYADLIVGAYNYGAEGYLVGRAYVYSGLNGLLLHTFTGEAPYDRFGWSVSGAGDVNNDGSADLIVGAYDNDAGGTDAGRAYVFTCLPSAPGTVIYHEGWDAGTLAGWQRNQIACTVAVVNTGGNPNGYLYCSKLEGFGLTGIGAVPYPWVLPDDYASAGVRHLSFDFLLINGAFSELWFRLRYLDASHNGWHYPFPGPYSHGGWVHHTVTFNPKWSDEEAVAAGWVKEDVSPSFAETMAAVYSSEVRVTGPGPLEFGIDNFELMGSLEVPIDIMPGNCPNAFSTFPGRHISRPGPSAAAAPPMESGLPATLDVAIPGTPEFDVSKIAASTLTLHGVTPLRFILKDVATPLLSRETECECVGRGADGVLDLLLTFDFRDVLNVGDLSSGSVCELSIDGRLKDRSYITGSDCLSIQGGVNPGAAGASLPAFSLGENYPDPFNAETVIEYTIDRDCRVALEIFNVLGQRVAIIVDGFQAAGQHRAAWDGQTGDGGHAASGVYLYRLIAGDKAATKKMTLLK